MTGGANLPLGSNPAKGAVFAAQLVNDEISLLVDIERVVDIFISQNMTQPAMYLLLDKLKDNKPEQGPLQTRLLEMYLMHVPQVADAILKNNNMFTYYDEPRIVNLCEKAGLLQRALEHYKDFGDIKRAVVHTTAPQSESLVNYFGRLTTGQPVSCSMQEMLCINIWQILQVVLQIATKYSDVLGLVRLTEMVESFKSYKGLCYYLVSVVTLSEGSEVRFKYIHATPRSGQICEVERICHESNFYNSNPEKVKSFLKEVKLSDQPLFIIICNRFDFVHDLVLYLRNPQNLLMLTTISTLKGKVVSYTDNLQNYDSGEIAGIAAKHGLYEEAISIYKYDDHAMVTTALVNHSIFMNRSVDYANRVSRPEVWSHLVRAQFDSLSIEDSISSKSIIVKVVSIAGDQALAPTLLATGELTT